MSPLLDIQDLRVEFRSRRGFGPWGSESCLRAVDGVDLAVAQGSAIGVVGESGCGKSTFARAITGLVPMATGTIILDGSPLPEKRSQEQLRRIQMVFQDPSSSLNPQITVGAMLRELLTVNHITAGGSPDERVRELLDLVQLPAAFADRYPRRLSGGQRQRVGIARALALDPDIIVADEPVAALDVSVQAAILNLLNGLRSQLGLTLIFISHDLGVVRHVCDQVAVLYLGRIVELADSTTIFEDPKHPYTKALIRAVPLIEGDQRPGQSGLQGEPPSPANRPSGCAFRQRCPAAVDRCASDDPVLRIVGGHGVACHVAD